MWIGINFERGKWIFILDNYDHINLPIHNNTGFCIVLQAWILF